MKEGDDSTSGGSPADVQPMTERSNPITGNIDVATATEMVKLIAKADEEIFTSEEGALCERVVGTLAKISALVAELQRSGGDIRIVLSGSGTSGRLAFIVSKTFNEYLQLKGMKPTLQYLISGGDKALFMSQELAEDDPHTGMSDLEKAIGGVQKVLCVGITCGLSAPYVAGQLDYCTRHEGAITPVLMGFNTLQTARDLPIENWDKTFRQVAHSLFDVQEKELGFLLNPIIGPEPITGSTRMKGGSATKILLDSLFTRALVSLDSDACKIPTMKALLESFYKVQRELYMKHEESLAQLIQLGGICLNSGGHIYYVSGESLGLMALIDASECVPTFGSDENDVRGFVHSKHALENEQTLDYFISSVLPTVNIKDLLVFIVRDDVSWISDVMINCPAVKCLISISSSDFMNQMTSLAPHMTATCMVTLTPNDADLFGKAVPVWVTAQMDYLCKLVCNLLTTGAHILKGKVIENFMADLKIRNRKLYHRAIHITEKFGGCDEGVAEICLLRSAYGRDSLSEEERHAPISHHILASGNRDKVVPVAILLAKLNCSVAEAEEKLRRCPVTRTSLLGDKT